MPSFPTSPHTFTDFANGALSDAAQVTSIYDEVEAIEAGYLNGTARLNSSNSTLANLSVSGGSTFTGSVVCSSLVAMPGQTRCILTHSTVQQIVNGAWESLNWDTESTDVGGMHSTAANSSRAEVPAGSSGLYLCRGMVQFAADSTAGYRAVRFVDGAGTEYTGSRTMHSANPSAGDVTVLQTALVTPLNAGDMVILQCITNQGSTSRISGVLAPRLEVCRMY